MYHYLKQYRENCFKCAKSQTLVYNTMQMIKSNLFINFTTGKKGDRGTLAVKIRNRYGTRISMSKKVISRF